MSKSEKQARKERAIARLRGEQSPEPAPEPDADVVGSWQEDPQAVLSEKTVRVYSLSSLCRGKRELVLVRDIYGVPLCDGDEVEVYENNRLTLVGTVARINTLWHVIEDPVHVSLVHEHGKYIVTG